MLAWKIDGAGGDSRDKRSPPSIKTLVNNTILPCSPSAAANVAQG